MVQALEETLAVHGRAPDDEHAGRSLPKIEPLAGSLQPELKPCGRPACRCARGLLHGPYWSLRWREGGRQHRCYVRPADLEQVQASLAAWCRLHPPARSLRVQLAELRRLVQQLDTWGV